MVLENKKFSVLVIEDDELDRLVISKALQNTDIKPEIVFAYDLESGIEAAFKKNYDCIFLDYNLPGGTGHDLLRKIRDKGNLSPVIVVTSQGDERIAVEMIKSGASDYIPKDMLTSEGTSKLLSDIIEKTTHGKSQNEVAILVSPPDEIAENLTLVFKIKDFSLKDYLN